ncbi:MAG TPA: riboflavin synthase [Firmicutes bacterium]|nr:riboflavin synthase [Bacillota bacterium]
MFTGLVEEVGTVRSIRRGRDSAVLEIGAETVTKGLRTGDSVAVNGVCLTAVSCREDSFSADVMHETLNRSSLAQLRSGSHVNLERAMPADGRFGGHIVAGHVDGVGRILGTEKDGTAVWYRIGADQSVLRYVVEKGSVAVDGISLTVAAVTETDFSVSLIPHTARMTILGEKKAGDPVNLETDIVGKYVEKLMKPADTGGQKGQSGITREFLEKYGF